VAIARALVQEPEIILADEPIASLDPGNAVRVMAALRAINHEDGLTVICNLHTLDTARTYCDRVIGMAHGQLVFDGAPAALTPAVLQAVYGIDAEGRESDAALTSTSLRPPEAHQARLLTAAP
jgi:phosphonate transport system ATP-binding protein